MTLLRHRIVEQLDKVGQTESWLAEECGWSRRKLASILSGKIPLKSGELREIENALNIRFDLTYAETPNG